MIDRYDYVEMRDKIYSYIPQSSIIGCMLYHDLSRRIVKSTNENIKQHQVSSWVIKDNHFEFTNETDELSKFTDRYLKKLTAAVGEENIEDVFETVFDFLENAGINDIEDIKAFHFVNLAKAIGSLKNISDSQKEIIESTLKQAIKELSHLAYSEGISTINKRLSLGNK